MNSVIYVKIESNVDDETVWLTYEGINVIIKCSVLL